MIVDMDEVIIKEATFYLENDMTIEETASELGISKSTLQKHIKRLESINSDLYNKIRLMQEERQKQGRIKGGTLGHRTTIWTNEDALRIADIFITGEYTLDELAKITSVSRSTLYEILTSSVIPEEKRNIIEAIFVANKKGISLDELQVRSKI